MIFAWNRKCGLEAKQLCCALRKLLQIPAITCFPFKDNRGQWLPESIIFPGGGSNEKLTIFGDFVLGKPPKATPRQLLIWGGLSSGCFCTKCLHLGCTKSSCTSPGCGGKSLLWMLFILFFFRYWSILLVFHEVKVFCSFDHCCWWGMGKRVRPPECLKWCFVCPRQRAHF